MNDTRIPIHHDAYCVFHDLPIIQDGLCKECKEELKPFELPDPFDEVLGG